MRIKCTEPPNWMVVAEHAAKKLWPYHNHTHYRDDAIAIVVSISDEQMEVCWISYCLKWAQDRELIQGFPPVQTLSVCAIVRANAQILVGKRSDKLLSYPDCWEFAPAGGVDRSACEAGGINLERQVLREWSEEVCCSTRSIVNIEWGGVLHCSTSSTWVGQFRILSKPFDPTPNDEVALWRWVPSNQLAAELSASPANWVPCSSILFERMREKSM